MTSPDSPARIYSMRENGLLGDPIIRLVFAGDSGVGKSALFFALADGAKTTEYIPTIGVDFRYKRLEVDGQPVKLQLWDTAGQERYRSISASYFRSADVVLLAFDITCRKSFSNLGEWVHCVDACKGARPMYVVVGNKLDRGDKREVGREEAERFAENLGPTSFYVEVSALEGTHLDSFLDRVAWEALKTKTGSQATVTIHLGAAVTAATPSSQTNSTWRNIIGGYC